MTAAHRPATPEPAAPDPDVLSLYEHAAHLHRLHPDGPIPGLGRPFPGERGTLPEPPRRPLDDRAAELRALLAGHFAAPDAEPAALSRRLAALQPLPSTIQRAFDPGPALPAGRARTTARWLVRHAPDAFSVVVGLTALARYGTRDDVPAVRIVGLLGAIDRYALDTLLALGADTSDLIWYAERGSLTARRRALEALFARTGARRDATLVRWLLTTPVQLPPQLALKTAEFTAIADRLLDNPPDPAVVDQAGRLLCGLREAQEHVDAFAADSACRTLTAYAAVVGRLRPTIDRIAAVAALIAELRTGRAALLDWHDGEREWIDYQLADLLESPDWADLSARSQTSRDADVRRRAYWAADCARTPPGATRAPGGRNRIALRISSPDPARPTGKAEARVLIDGLPVAAGVLTGAPALFPPNVPCGGALRAAVEPHELLLWPYGVAPGSGPLRLTVARDHDSVIWRERPAGSGTPGPPLD
ncbi:MAG: hypothetical protein HOV68_23900, partial [Streptomycetaceae bacterium]|nr:hypothetical protein [Streptomycetaceae bacterium]